MSEINEQDRLHQLLCAYVLGEADAAERTEVEAALARDPALCAERDRIAATIGLVKGAFDKDETLSYRATSEVTRAAADMLPKPVPASRPFVWYQSTSLRVAASVVAVVGASFLGWRAFVARSDVKPNTYLAKVEKYSPGSRDRELRLSDSSRVGAEAKEGVVNPDRGEAELDALGYTQSTPPASDPAQLANSAAAAKQALESLSKAKNPEEKLEANLRKANEDSLALRAAGLKDDVKASDGTTALGSPADCVLPKEQAAPQTPQALYAVVAGQEPQLEAPLDSRFGQSAEKTGADEYYLGKGEVGGATGATAIGVGVSPGHFASGTPAASTPAQKAGGGGGGGGPSTPGPAGPGAPGGASAPVAGKPRTGGSGLLNQLTPGDPLGSTKRDGNSKARTEGDYDWEVEAGETFGLADEPADGQTAFERVDRFKEAGKSGEVNDELSRRQRRILTPEERQARIEEIIASCRRLPNEAPRDMFFRFWGDNPFEWTGIDRQSTFSMDVDTASYTLARKYLVDGHLPEKSQIRTEEFVNYFKPDIAPPTKGTFTIATEMAPNRFSNPVENKWMLRVAVRGKEVTQGDRDPMALTLVVDVSGSMKEQQRLELVKNAMRQLVRRLDGRDSIAIVAFSTDTRLILPMTSIRNRDLIESAIEPLQPEGSTNTEAGLRMGYEQALAAQTKNTINRVVLLTDGVANVGIVDPNVLVQSVERQRKAGIYLNTIGVGMNNHNDNLLEQLADKGDGVCNYVDDAAEVRHVLVDNFLQTLVPIARDAKVQVEFDPAQVASYRLLGYENRAIADQDFRNDKVDAGEINSGHQITALYEIVRVGNLQNMETPLAKVHVRFKPPHKDGVAQAGSEEASEISSPVFGRNAAGKLEAASFGYRRAILAAQFAEFLRRSVHARGDSLDELIADLQRLSTDMKGDQEVVELTDMVVKSKGLLQAEFARRGELEARVYELRRLRWERAQLESQHREDERALLQRLDDQVASLEGTLRSMAENRVK